MTCCALAGILLAMVGCGLTQPAIPNKVTTHEYEIYSAWLQHYFSAEPPVGKIYISARTFKFDPIEEPCGKNLQAEGQVPRSMMEALHALGDAEYRLDVYPPKKNLRLAWPFEPTFEVPHSPEPYHFIAFSRVAFNSARTQALFAINHTCGGLCGSGGAVVARWEGKAWVFRGAGCRWVS